MIEYSVLFVAICSGIAMLFAAFAYARRQDAEVHYTDACTNKVNTEIYLMTKDDEDKTFT